MYDDAIFLAKVLSAYGIDYTQNKIMCPFHDDINPSMAIDFEKSRVFCFGCQRGFSPIEFVKAAEPKLNALSLYSRLAQIENGQKIQLDRKYIQKNTRVDYEQALIQAQDYYFNLPKVNWVRDCDLIEEYFYLEKRGLFSGILYDCGAKISYSTNYPVVFPLMDNGVFRGWVSRTFDVEIEKKRKYLYNTGFRRATTLCGRYKKESPLIIVEGYIDMLKIMQAGYRNCIALLGWKISKEQIEKLQETNIQKVVLALDNDEKGIEGNDYLRTLGFKKTHNFPYDKKHKDPGSYGNQELKAILRELKLL